MREYYIIFFLTFFLSPNQFVANLAQKHILNVLGHGGSCARLSIVKEAGVKCVGWTNSFLAESLAIENSASKSYMNSWKNK